MSPRDVAVIGPGRVGTLLATSLARAGRRVVAVAGGTAAARDRVAAAVAGCRPCADPAEAVAAAGLVVLCVPDDAVEPAVTELAAADAWRSHHHVVHLAGSHGLEPLRRAGLAGARPAACHPAMTVPAGSLDPDLLVGVPWAVTVPSGEDGGWAHELVRDLGGDPTDVPDPARALYHAGLAVASNAAGAVAVVARQLLLAARIEDPARFLAPLLHRSVDNVLADGAAALTGPVVRGDLGTVARHLDVLDRDVPELADAYRQLTSVLLGRVRAELPPETAAALAALLDAPGSEPSGRTS